MKRRQIIPPGKRVITGKLRYHAALLLALIAFVVFPAVPVMADQDYPSSTPTAEVYIFRNVLETGDYFMYIYANIPYTVAPDNLINESFIWRLMDVDGVTELGRTTMYPFNENGYGYNVAGMYWSASDAPTWGTLYTLRLSGNPSIFSDPPTYNFPLQAGDYSTITATFDVLVAISDRVIVDAGRLDIAWGLTTVTTLLDESEVATVLSQNGESFYRNAIFGIQAMAPAAFSFGVVDFDYEKRIWNTEYATNLTSQYGGTWIATAQTAGADMFSASYDILSVILLIIIGVLIIVGNIVLSANHWSALMDVSVVLVVAARLGLYEASFIGLIAALSWLYVSAKTWGKVS